MKKGFTLVELSIVLVIIGLISAGILAAQSMISTTRVQGFLRQIAQSDIAISNYQLMYNGLPGDLTGNKNGVIEDDGTGKGPNYIVKFNGEAAQFWADLSTVGFDPQHKYTATITGTFNSNPTILNAPVSRFGDNGSIIPSTWDSDKIYNWYRVGNFSTATAANPSVYPNYPVLDGTYVGEMNAMRSVDVLSICAKLDDATMQEGNGGTFVDPTKVAFGIHYPEWDQGCTLAHDKCNIYIRMLSQVGQRTK